MQLHSTVKYSQGTLLLVDGVRRYRVHACINLCWISNGESHGYHLVLIEAQISARPDLAYNLNLESFIATPIIASITCKRCNKPTLEVVSTMRVELMGGIVCAVNADVMICKTKTCQHSQMSDEQSKAFKVAVLKEFKRKSALPPKAKHKLDIIE